MFASKESEIQIQTKSSHLSRFSSASTIGHLGKEGNVPTFDAMDEEDVQCCFVYFKDKTEKEMASLCYELVKMSRDQDSIMIEDLQHFCHHMIDKDPAQVLEFYKESKLDPRVPINKPEFIQHYHEFKKIEMFHFIENLADGYKDEYLNGKSLWSAKMFDAFKMKFTKARFKDSGIEQFEAFARK
jgi:hypothetical protein